MTKRILSLFLLLCVFISAAGCSSGTAPGGSPGASATAVPTPTATVPATPEPTPTPDPVQARLDAMTTEEKVGQLLMAGFEGTEPGGDAAVFLQDYQVGGLILFGRNIESAEQLTALTNGLKTLNGDQIPLLIGVDQEGGWWTGCRRRSTAPPARTPWAPRRTGTRAAPGGRPGGGVRGLRLPSGLCPRAGRVEQPGQHRHR